MIREHYAHQPDGKISRLEINSFALLVAGANRATNSQGLHASKIGLSRHPSNCAYEQALSACTTEFVVSLGQLSRLQQVRLSSFEGALVVVVRQMRHQTLTPTHI